MSAMQFIDQLEAQGLLSPDIIEELRRQVAESKSRITPSTLARLLVDNGHLTKFQATKLVSELNKDVPPPSSSRSAAVANKPVESDDLDLAPLEDQAAHSGSGNKASIVVDDDELVEVSDAEIIDDEDDVADVEVIDEDEDVETVEVIDDDEELVAASEIVEDEPEEVEVIEEAPQAPRKRITKLNAPSKGTSSSSGSASPLKTPKKLPANNKPQKPGANPWESHRILTVGGVLAILSVLAVALIWYFMSGNADAMLAQAEEAYKPNNYEAAIKQYEAFAEGFPAHPEASFARVRAGMAKIRKDIDGLPDPNDGLKTVKEILPVIGKEPALSGERGDVAGALVSLAQKFNQRADNTPETAVKKSLMTSMDELNTLLNDSQYVGNTARQQNAIALAKIDEDRQRILRDISRDEDLQAALTSIDAKLAEKATPEAYQIRRDLINKFPQLEKDPSLIERVQKATLVQRELVAPASLDIKTQTTAPVKSNIRAVALANRVGKDATSLAGRILAVRAKGSVYGLDGKTGNVLWRYFGGRDMTDEPIRANDEPTSDVFVGSPSPGHLVRLDGTSGTVKWFTDLGAPALTPRISGEDLLVGMRDGHLINLDPQSGEAKWIVKIPQSVEVTPNVDAEKPNIYLPGNHNNLYVLSRQDGKCKEVYYVGHRAGTVVVPPIHLLGMVFLFENITTERTLVRILQADDGGLNLKVAQEEISIDGNVTTPPLIDGRKIIVLSDRGQIKVLDVDPASTKNKVSEVASEVASENRPKMTWGVSEGSQLWMANTRFTRWDVQVNTGKLVRPWIVDDGDQFSSAPQKYGDVIVHTRVVRGNRGVRVSAVTAATGEPIWLNDIAVPIVLLASPSAGKFDAVTTSATQFAIDVTQTLQNQAEISPEGIKPGVTFENPRVLSNGAIALNNVSTESRIGLYTPSAATGRLKVATANFAGGKPTAPPAVVGDDLAFGLDNGQLMVIKPTNGASSISPFQPPVEPGSKHRWSQPAYNAELKTLYATDIRRKLYRLSTSGALRSLSDVDVDGTVVGPLAVVDKQVALVMSNSSDERLMVYDGTTLEKAGQTPLDGRWSSGPYSIAPDRILVQTERKLEVFGTNGEKQWSIDFPKVRLAGAPAVSSFGVAIAATSGQAWLIDPATGTIKNTLDAGQPLSASPLTVPGGMLLGTDEGNVLLMRLTDDSASAPKGAQ